MKLHALAFLFAFFPNLYGEPIDQELLEKQGQIPGLLIQPEYRVANWDETLADLDSDAFERETGNHMADLHEPNNPGAQDRKLFYLHPNNPTSGRGTKINIATDKLASFRSGPKPLDIPHTSPKDNQPACGSSNPCDTPLPEKHEALPEPAPEPEPIPLPEEPEPAPIKLPEPEPEPLPKTPEPVPAPPPKLPKLPEPVAPAPEPADPVVRSRYQPVIIHHEDPSNPARKVSIHNIANHLIPYQHRPDRPELEPKDPEPEPINVQPEVLDSPGCPDNGSVNQQQEGHKVVKVTEHGFEVIQPKLLPIPKPIDCNKPKAPPPIIRRPRTVRNEPLLVKPCGMVMPGEPCYTTPIPTMFPTTTTTTRRPTNFPTTTTTTTRRPTNFPTTTKRPTDSPTTTRRPTNFPTTTTRRPTPFPTTTTRRPTGIPTSTETPTKFPTTTKKPTNGPTTTKKPSNQPTTTTKTIVIQPVIIVPDVTSTPMPDVPEGCEGAECKDKFINGVEEQGEREQQPIPAPPQAVPQPKPQPPKQELHVHHFHISPDGTVQSAYTKSLLNAGRNPEDDPMEEEGKKYEGLDLPPCNLNDPNQINCDMSSALSKAAMQQGISPSDLKAAANPSVDNINDMLNDNPPDDDVALAAMETRLEKESAKENKHLKELQTSEAKLELTHTKGRAEEEGLALEKREVAREIAASKRKIKKSQDVEAKLAAKKQEAETQLALKNKKAQGAMQEAYVKAAQQNMMDEQQRQDNLQNMQIQSQTQQEQESAVNENNSDLRVASSLLLKQHPERIAYLLLVVLLSLFVYIIYTRKQTSSAGYVALLHEDEEV